MPPISSAPLSFGCLSVFSCDFRYDIDSKSPDLAKHVSELSFCRQPATPYQMLVDLLDGNLGFQIMSHLFWFYANHSWCPPNAHIQFAPNILTKTHFLSSVFVGFYMVKVQTVGFNLGLLIKTKQMNHSDVWILHAHCPPILGYYIYLFNWLHSYAQTGVIICVCMCKISCYD